MNDDRIVLYKSLGSKELSYHGVFVLDLRGVHVRWWLLLLNLDVWEGTMKSDV